MVFRVRNKAPHEVEAIDCKENIVYGYLSEDIDDSEFGAGMTPAYIYYWMIVVHSGNAINIVFFAHPPLAVARITHQMVQNDITTILTDVCDAAILGPCQFPYPFLE